MQNVRYCYAYDDLNRLVHIKDAHKIDSIFTCPHCKSEMIKKCGQHNAWHFAHKHKQCDYDKYLHTIAEIRILEWFNTSNQVLIELDHRLKCPHLNQCKWQKEYENYYDEEPEGYCYKDFKRTHNLKEWFHNAELEKVFVKKGETFVADIFCHNQRNDNDPLFLEICVTHRCSPEKIASGIKIIEFDIASETDIDTIISSPQKECSNIHFYNFQPKGQEGQLQDFGRHLLKFILMPSYKGYINYNMFCHELCLRRGIFELTIGISYNRFYWTRESFYAIATAVANKHFQFNSCVLCKYQAYSEWDNTSICKLYKKCGTNKYNKDNNPIECPFYRRNEKKYQEMINVFNDYCINNPVDIWIKEQ